MVVQKIRNDNPDKGTEALKHFGLIIICYEIRNDNPDKGTEDAKATEGTNVKSD